MENKILVKPIIAGSEFAVDIPSYAFLVTHPTTNRKVLFDLGTRKDIENGPRGFAKDSIGNANPKFKIKVPTNVSDILIADGVELKSVEAIVWSHHHWDHTGDPALFPSDTALIVGPDFKKRYPKAYPSVPDASVDERAWEGRELREISFEECGLKIGRFSAFDYFGDGSFYILDTPGHCLGHLCGLARTTRDTYIFMGGDAAHHCGEIRPTEFRPLPKEVNLQQPIPKSSLWPCPGELLQHYIHPEGSATTPFHKPSDIINETPEQGEWTIEGLTEFDADDRVLMVLAHDASLLSIVDLFPSTANKWQSQVVGTLLQNGQLESRTLLITRIDYLIYLNRLFLPY
jgi:glyoxylase-like metal-dependent hydrolase (beta-lactamase superfamily II)